MDNGNNGKKNGTGMIIAAVVAALGVGGGGIGILGNQTDTAADIAALEKEIASMKVLMADEEKRMIALVAATDEETADRFRRGRDDLDDVMGKIRETVHELELDFARIHGHNPQENH